MNQKKLLEQSNDLIKDIGLNAEDYSHLSFAEMSDLPEMAKIKSELIQLEEEWFDE